MLFSSQPFIFLFLPLALIAYYHFAANSTQRLAAVLSASAIFYAWWDPRFLPLLFGTVLINWLLVQLSTVTGNKGVLTLGVVFNLAVLGFFKYTNFFAESVLSIAGIAHEPWSIILPLGISFFTFQQISYLLDVKRGEATPYGLLEYAAYVSFFPQLIAGPIVRHNELVPQLRLNPIRSETLELAGRGLVLFTLGLVKKVLFADELAPIADDGFDAVAGGGTLSAAVGWTSALAYSLQLYFDFSAYSDMALGLGGMFGFRLPINFNAPYRATDIRDFWRRWHMTLSSFLRDYVYIPLGGSRGSLLFTCWTVMLTMLLCGLWHGAGWTFVAWGALHGLAICANRLWLSVGFPLPSIPAWVITMLFVIAGWVLFRAETFHVALDILTSMMSWGEGATLGLDAEDAQFVALGALIAIVGPTNVELAFKSFIHRRPVAIATAVVLMAVCLRVGQGRGLEFIYFQF